MRLQKFLRDQGIASLRKCDELIQEQKIFVNGAVIKEPTYYLNPTDTVSYKNQSFIYEEKKTNHIYLKLHKPKGVLCSHTDDFKRKTIFDLIDKKKFHRLFFAGRLDLDARGLVILSSNGLFVQYLSHPSCKQKKEYIVKTQKKIDERRLRVACRGIKIERQQYASFSYKILDTFSFKIWLREGKKREIKEIIAWAGNEVVDLKRLSVGAYFLGNLQERHYESFLPIEKDQEEMKKLMSLKNEKK